MQKKKEVSNELLFHSPANIETTLSRIFSTLCTGLHRSADNSYPMGSSPGACNIDMQTRPSAKTVNNELCLFYKYLCLDSLYSLLFGWNMSQVNFIFGGLSG